MFILDSDCTVFFDIDDTLVGWNSPPENRRNFVDIECDGIIDTYWIIDENVKALKRHRARGHKVVVWSQGGYKWAEAVVKALKLENFVDLVCSKPKWYYDDIPCQAWMGKRLYGNFEPGKQTIDPYDECYTTNEEEMPPDTPEPEPLKKS